MAARPASVSLVIPVFNEGPNLDALLARVGPVLDEIGRDRFMECVVVDDGSTDDSLARLLAARARDPRIKVVEFNRNYGQHAAVFAGFEHSTGEVVITLDADLQNPPEEIPKLLEKIDEGHDVVGTRRLERQDSGFRRFASRVVNRITRRMIGVDSGDFGCMLRAYRREVVDAMSSSKELSTFIPALAELFAANSVVIDVRHEARAGGESKYSLRKLLKLHFDLVTSFSVAPLRFFSTLGILVGALGILLAGVILTIRLTMTRDEWQAWGEGGLFTLFAILIALIGAQFFAIGIVGEYVGRIYGEVRRRPRFVVRSFHRDEGAPGTVTPMRSPGAHDRSPVRPALSTPERAAARDAVR